MQRYAKIFNPSRHGGFAVEIFALPMPSSNPGTIVRQQFLVVEGWRLIDHGLVDLHLDRVNPSVLLGNTSWLEHGSCSNHVIIWMWVKSLVPSEPQNSWDLWMFIPLKMVSIGIDPYPYVLFFVSVPHGKSPQIHRDPSRSKGPPPWAHGDHSNFQGARARRCCSPGPHGLTNC